MGRISQAYDALEFCTIINHGQDAMAAQELFMAFGTVPVSGSPAEGSAAGGGCAFAALGLGIGRRRAQVTVCLQAPGVDGYETAD